ncbi:MULTISPECIES: DUF6804 family protein [Chryseobacterium]|uniref:4-hydroxybenzoate polyprenyltransferase n=1 Tax=Chryseobacterium camelliae TaxID=1265445 RepID=A0ABU0TMM5_9FLAO|nr:MULTISPECIES: DUF6804 family protein [Chryseobacterium]MDT3407852.1 4-hydroxybenzoate polyprenyltransferase [Pseudacidovorax intermedius]MDQ1098293.1 4-hydroxybenzoate polyprenyltransferase [Chryseobacterium camelliae]MDQ1102219.1 4-hydroxybenzoate polyprenyltransferase [Chryseobacterium sp. SORGH_AS_1048]MDR6085656.1 4-hydroxybenzoate polyprenyltransferase [Chryseobacterium sp. SORGH_AS_0909]MDR6130024.1 4-hydroxybenzoate polyprenyltransferase [Chryseobacterium sp. SORGH_AS_1175]
MKALLILCATACFLAIYKLPIEYYTFLRTLVSVGALIIIYNGIIARQYYLSVIFAAVLMLFNPVFPIYLYRKSLWIPIDTITGILFFLIAFADRIKAAEKQEEKKEEPSHSHYTLITHARDMIMNPKKPKEH